MKTQHTPGPWAITEQHGNWEIVTDKKGNVVANVNYESGPDLPPLVSTKMPTHNNARLIAAAPELLEACKQVRTMLDSMQKSRGVRIAWSSECFDNSVGESLRALDASIAKATGQ